MTKIQVLNAAILAHKQFPADIFGYALEIYLNLLEAGEPMIRNAAEGAAEIFAITNAYAGYMSPADAAARMVLLRLEADNPEDGDC